MPPIIKVAKTGGTVEDQEKYLAFSSEENYMTIIGEYNGQADSSGNADITHNLGYIPSFYFFSSQDGSSWSKPGEPSVITGSHADSSKVYIRSIGSNNYYHVVLWANAFDDNTDSSNDNASGVIKIARSGFDASEDTDLRRFLLASGESYIIIKEKKKISITISASLDAYGFWQFNQSQSYAHGLGYVPQVHVFGSDGGQIPKEIYYGGGNGIEEHTFSVDDEYLTITHFGSLNSTMFDDPSGATFDYYSHIFFNKIA